MNQNNHYELRYQKLQIEAMLKSLICGACIAFSVDFVLGIVFWALGTDSLPLVLGILLGIAVGGSFLLAPLFYFTKFRPTILNNARRIDKLGLEERVITMLELQNDDSCIARLQRDDAIGALSMVDQRYIRFNFNPKMLITLLICGILGMAMITVASLSAAGLLPRGNELFSQPPQDIYISVSYMVDEGGYIEGESEQLILMGESAESVVAIPDEGYVFDGWDDGYKKPSRTDKEIDHPLVLTAIFVPIGDDGEDGDEGDEGENGEEPGEEEGESGQPGDSNNPGDESDKEGEGQGKYNKVNQIIDGETYYRAELDAYKETIMELLKKRAEELTEEEKAIIEAYINIV